MLSKGGIFLKCPSVPDGIGGKRGVKMKFKRNRLFIVLLCLFVCFSGLVYKASGAPGDLCTANPCTNCHNEYIEVCSSEGVYLRQIDSNTEKHGLGNADGAVTLNIHKDTPPDLYSRLVGGML